MVETIAPVVHGDSRTKYRMTLLLHALGAVLAAALVGTLAGTIGMVLGAPWGTWSFVAVGSVAVVYAAREITGLKIPIPDRHRQVPLWWRSFYSAPVAGFLYGLGIGVGYLTYLSFGTYVAVTAAAVAWGSPPLGAALTAPFGLGRALSVALANRRAGEDRPSGIDRIDDLAGTRWPRVVNGTALIVTAAIAVLMSL
ncbi:MAG: hypothetical protein M3285_06490 [Actinomycetota bacterium]|nr:hypothetical protein [Actinomycetota bacterium]